MKMKHHLTLTCLCFLTVGSVMNSSLPQANAMTDQPQQQSEGTRTLAPGATTEREISGEETHVWRINLSAGDYMRLIVTRKTGKLAASLFAPESECANRTERNSRGDERKSLLSTTDNNVIFEHASSSRLTAIFSFVAEVSGEYRLETLLLDKSIARAQYEVKIDALRPATPGDRLRVAAEKSELEGNLVLDRDTTLEGRLSVIVKYESSLALWRELGDRSGELKLLRKLVSSYQQLGEIQTTLKYQSQAIQIARDLGNRYEEANLTLTFGHIQRSLGYMQKALDAYQRARDIFAGLSARLGEAIAIENTGGIYLALGEPREALNCYDKALPAYLSVGEPFGQSNVLNSMGLAHRRLDKMQEAIELYARALESSRKNGLPRLEASTLGNLGAAYLALGDKQKAADYYNQELALCRRVGARACTAAALNSLGEVAFLSGETERSLDYLGESLKLFRMAGERKWEATALQGLARTNYKLGNLSEARKQIEAALEIGESMRANIGRQDLRASFFGSLQSGFELYVDLLMTQHRRQPGAGHDAAALQASERARARSLLEQLAESNADIRQGVAPQLLELERALQQQLSAKAIARATAFNKKETEPLALSIDKEIDELAARYREVEARIRDSSPRYAALTRPQPLTTSEIQQQLLDENTVLLEYALGEKRSWLWAVTRDSISSHELPPRAEVDAAARGVYKLLTARQPNKDSTEAERLKLIAEADARLQAETAALSRMLLGPISAQLRQEWKGRRLAVVASGALEYTPFAALPLPESGGAGEREGGKQGDKETMGEGDKVNPQSAIRNPQLFIPLIVDHEVVNLPSASALALIRREAAGRRAATRTLAALADPVFDANDPRLMTAKKKAFPKSLIAGSRPAEFLSASSAMPSDLTRAAQSFHRDGFGRLVFSNEEAEIITRFAPKGSTLKATGFEANRQLVASGELGRYRIVHFATHGLINSEHPELSGLVLSLLDENGKSQDGFLRMSEIFNLRLPADLVVLSACQTALGKEIKGEGLVGLTRGFMYAGAERVVASLWQVDDQATAQLMRYFYHGMLRENLRPAAALRAAQIEMSRSSRWSSPYYWSGFVIQGEWR
jgi:tetratricopeptide (TPR) repeat protein